MTGAQRDLLDLPKAHLHVHLEAAMRADTYREFAGAAAVDVPIPAHVGWPGLSAIYRTTTASLTSRDRMRRLIREFVADNVSEGCVWVEPQIYPPVHRRLFGSDDVTVGFVAEELAQALARHEIAGGLMVTVDRSHDVLEAISLARVAVRHAGPVVSFGIANIEHGNPVSKFAEAIAVARDGGLAIAPHAGEMAGADAVRDALECRPHRIQHGITAAQDPTLLADVASAGIVLDICIESNVQLGFVTAVAQHPLAALVAAGVKVSLNADNPLAFGTNVVHEYELARRILGLDDHQLARIAASSLDGANAPHSWRSEMQHRVHRWELGQAAGPSPDCQRQR